MKHGRCVIMILALSGPSSAADDIGERRERQVAIRGDTDQLVRRIGTMLRVMDHYKLDEAASRRLLEEAAATLQGLSSEQMAAVIEKLDAAAVTADADAARQQLDEAYSGHRDAMRRLRGLLANFDSLRTLEDTRARLDRSARAHLELSFRLADILADSVESTKGSAAKRIQRSAEFPTVRAMREAEEQHDQRREVEIVLRQIAGLTVTLPAGDRERVKHVTDRVIANELLNRLADLPRLVKSDGGIPQRQADWRRAVDTQWQVAADLQAMAAEVLPPRDRLQQLRDARNKLSALVTQYAAASVATTNLFAQSADAQSRDLSPDESRLVQLRQLADGQGRFAFVLNGLKAAVSDSAQPVVPSLERAIVAMRAAGSALRHSASFLALINQAWAEAQLRTALRELEPMVARAEKERRDPLAAIEAALARIDKLIAEQSNLRDQTDAARADAKQLLALAPPQRELGHSGEELANTPLPTADVIKQLLTDAAADMLAAADGLAAGASEPTLSRQQGAIVRLRAARLHLERDRANIVKRRDELSQLTNAKKQLGDLVTDERRIADSAAAANADAKALAADQDKLQKPTKEVANSLQTIAPDAAGDAATAAAEMTEASALFRENRAAVASEKASSAADNLASAQSHVAKALRKRQAQEAIDQAKLRPNDVDAAQAAREVAKALNSADEAAKNSDAAAKSPLAEHLVQMQKEVADKARETGNAAAEPAGKALAEIIKGALREAVTHQQKALEQLEQDRQQVTLALQQKSVLDTTQSLLKAHEQNEMARSAVEQALAQAPDAVKRELDEAAKELRKAGEDLQKSKAKQAGAAQKSALQSLDEALEALREAAEELAKGQSPTQKSKPDPNRPPPPKNDKIDPSGDRADVASSGDKPSDGYSQNKTVRLNDAGGEGNFVHLPPRQRELIRQAITDKLPPEYAAAIQQYYVNIARGKPAAKPDAMPQADKK